MTDWIWQHVLAPAISGVFNVIPWWAWIIIAGLLLGWAWRTFGWQGLVGAGIAVLTLGAYREGWRAAESRRKAGAPIEDDPDFAPPIKVPKQVAPKPKVKHGYNPDTGEWE